MISTTLSLIFVNYRSAPLLKQALYSWRQPLAQIPHEIIIVNNDANEIAELETLVQSFPGQVLLRHSDQNLGFAQASNQGADLATGKFLFFLNPDTVYREGSLEALFSVFERRPNSFGGVRLVDERGREEAWSAGRFPTLLRLLGDNLLGEPYFSAWKRKQLAKTDWVSGAALMIPRDIFHALNGFDEQFFLYFEDVDLARRARNRGMVVWRSPRLTLAHIGGASHTTNSAKKRVYYESQRRYFAKHRSSLESVVLSLIHRFFFPS